MSEELLRAIIQLFSIVAKERVTEDERANIKEFLSFHLNQEALSYYLNLFDTLMAEYKPEIDGIEDTDEETLEFIDDWARIVEIGKRINQGLTRQQKLVLILKIIELIQADGEISERQSNLIFYIGEIIKVSQKDIHRVESFVRGTDQEELNSKEILIIDDGSGEHPYKSHRMAAKELTGLIAISRIPDSEIYFIKYLGISDITLNGVPLKSRQISIFPTGSTLRGSKIHTIYFSDIIGRFLSEETPDKISFVADNISYKFKSGDTGLKDIFISEDGGKLVGVMGASGSGKSTLLSVLNGTENPSSGSVKINGVDIHKEKERIEGVIGYVPQDDFLIEELTVFDNLYFAAKLCFDNLPEKEIHDLVLKKLKVLGLSETRDLKVGSILEKTISGGQRKRLNIGLELLREPSVLFVDEPTSGLSSRDSENIMDLLKELSLRGKMVFVVIHQPSSDIYKMFDSMIILDVGGYQIYYGNPLEAVVYFKTQVNMLNKDTSACIECGNVNAEQIFTIIENRVVNEFGRFTDQRKISPRQWRGFFESNTSFPEIEEAKTPVSSTLEIPNKKKQWKIYFDRDFLTKLGNRQYMLLALLEAPLLALFLSYLIRYYVTLENGMEVYIYNKNDNIPIYFFMSIIVAIFMGLTISAEEILRDRKMLKRESFLNLSRGSYLMAKISILFAISAIQTLSFIIIGNWILEVPNMHATFWFVLFTCSCFANLTGLNISSAFNSAVTIYVLIPLLIIPQLILSGIVVDFDRFNSKIAITEKVPWFGELMASRWAFEATMVNQFKDNEFEQYFYDADKRMSQGRFKINYTMSELETRLSRISNYLAKNGGDGVDSEGISADLLLLQNELAKEDKKFGGKFSYLNQLNLEDCSQEVLDSTRSFIRKLKIYYTQQVNIASGTKGKMLNTLNSTPENANAFNRLRDENANEKIRSMVINEIAPVKIVESRGRLIQKMDPIYTDPDPNHFLDFKANFYTPKKYIAGYTFDTFWFNIAVIWSLSLFLLIALYYEWLYKLIKGIEKSFKSVQKGGKYVTNRIR